MRIGFIVAVALGAIAVVAAPAAAVDFQLNMTGAQEVPAPGDPDGSANGILSIDPLLNKVSWNFTYANIAAPTLMHIHTGAAGVPGPVLVNLGVATSGGPGTLINMTTTSPAIINSILANPLGFYVNIHNAQFPGGAVRGQLVQIIDPEWRWVGHPGPAQVWTDPANWMGGNGGPFPNNPEAQVLLGDVIQENTTIALPVPITMTSLTFGSQTHSYTVGGPGSQNITFVNPGLTPITLDGPTQNVLCGNIFHSCIKVSGVPNSCLVFEGDIFGIAEGPASLIMPPVNVCDVILTGNNSFSGQVIVDGGRLKLSLPLFGPPGGGQVAGGIMLHTIPDDVALDVGPGGLVSIGQGLVEQVGALIINGVMQPPGMYGDENPVIEGGGFIIVASNCPPDFTGDGVVNGADLAVMLGAWGTPGADLTGDSTTNGADLAILLGAWGPCP